MKYFIPRLITLSFAYSFILLQHTVHSSYLSLHHYSRNDAFDTYNFLYGVRNVHYTLIHTSSLYLCITQDFLAFGNLVSTFKLSV